MARLLINQVPIKKSARTISALVVGAVLVLGSSHALAGGYGQNSKKSGVGGGSSMNRHMPSGALYGQASDMGHTSRQTASAYGHHQANGGSINRLANSNSYVNKFSPKMHVDKVSPRDFGTHVPPKTYVNKVTPQDLGKRYVNKVTPQDLGKRYVNKVSPQDYGKGMGTHSHDHMPASHAMHHVNNRHHEPYWWSHHHTPSWVSYCHSGWSWPYWNWTTACSIPLFGHCYSGSGYGGPADEIVSLDDADASEIAEAPAEPIEAIAEAAPIDLELSGLQLIVPGDATSRGPIYRVAIHNNSSVPAAAFDVALMATNGGNPDAKTPFAVQRVDGIEPDATVTVDLRLPAKANQLSRTPEGKVAPFTTLFAGVDPRGEIEEATKDNNVIRVARTDVPSSETASTN